MAKRIAPLTSLVLAAILLLGTACSNGDGDGQRSPTLRPPATGSPAGQPDTPATADPTLTLPPENSEANDREEFVDTVTAQLEQIKLRLDEVESEIEGMSGNEASEAKARLDALNTRISETEEQLDRVEDASDDEYEAIKRGVEENVQAAMTEAQQLAAEVGI